MKSRNTVVKKSIITMVLLLFATTGCITTSKTYEGAGIGGAIGAASGALLNKKNSWKGAVIGGTLGALAGGALVEISSRASSEAARNNRPVTYRTNNGYVVQSTPITKPSQNTECKKVQERVWKNGELVKEEIKEICEGKKKTYDY